MEIADKGAGDQDGRQQHVEERHSRHVEDAAVVKQVQKRGAVGPNKPKQAVEDSLQAAAVSATAEMRSDRQVTSDVSTSRSTNLRNQVPTNDPTRAATHKLA